MPHGSLENTVVHTEHGANAALARRRFEVWLAGFTAGLKSPQCATIEFAENCAERVVKEFDEVFPDRQAYGLDHDGNIR